MKQLIAALIGILSLTTCLYAQSVSPLSGVITDSATGKKLAGVSVFLNSTSKGTVTRADGTFQLGIPPGRYQLIVSAIGYETYVTEVSSRNLPPSLKITLRTKADELAAVTVEPYMKDGWKRWGKFFLDNFIGTTEYASSCTIKNKEVLRFHFYLKSNRLSVTAIEPLIIENKALGYDLEYRLEGFTCDFASHIVSYFGYPFFREMPSDDGPRQAKWDDHRRRAYLGSLMHFMRSLYAGRLHIDGFIVEHDMQVPNREKQRVKGLYTPNVTKVDSIPMDTLHHYWEILRQPDFYFQRVRSYEGLVTINKDQTRVLFFPGDCTVIYGNPRMGIAYQESAIRLMTQTPITVEENGNYFPPQEILSLGNWSKTETIGQLLPRDYEPIMPQFPATDQHSSF
jgi:hypothetical protein